MRHRTAGNTDEHQLRTRVVPLLCSVQRILLMRRFSGDGVVSVVEPFPNQPGEVPVGQSVDDVSPILLGVDHPDESKFGEVLADCGTRRIGSGGEFGDVGGTVTEEPEQV